MDKTIADRYRRWRERAADADVASELNDMAADRAKIEDAFYRELTFGTGGLRGVIGAGMNRMNIYTVAKASQGLADYVVKAFAKERLKIAVSFDSRVKSEVFAQVAAGVFSANGIEALLFNELMPTPCLSYAVRYLGCAAGVMVTASHNPGFYNGYKVYNNHGCQITDDAAGEIYAEIEKLDIFDDVKTVAFKYGVQSGLISFIPDEVYTSFINDVKKQSLLTGNIPIDKGAAIIYSPLNGAGRNPVLRALRESGYTNVTVVKEQEMPDGLFPTCPYPNPETKEAMELGIEYAEKHDAGIFFATDPDCDRAGVAVKAPNGDYVLLSGNETGVLLFDYICSRRLAAGTMPEDPVLIKTIVTTDMAERIAARYGVRVINVLTGFKFIGEKIDLIPPGSFIFAFEESCGYLTGPYVRDKDAVGGVLLICEMFAYYKTLGINLLDKLGELYREYGYCADKLHSYHFDGAAGFEQMKKIIARFRVGVDTIGGKPVMAKLDYSDGLDGLPKSDVIKFLLEDHCSVTVRPSGTEPKLKIYVSATGESAGAAAAAGDAIHSATNDFIADF